MPYMEMSHGKDPKQEIIDRIGDLTGIEVFGTQVLVGIYQRPEKTASGVYLPGAVQGEDVYQGKAGLVLQLGPLAFKDTQNYQFGGQSVSVGDWIIFKPGDAWPVTINSKDGACRILDDNHVRAKIAQPDHVW